MEGLDLDAIEARALRAHVSLDNTYPSEADLASERVFEIAARTDVPALVARCRELDHLLEKAEEVCFAASSVTTEENMREELLCYNMGCELLAAIAAWRKAKEG